MLKIAALLFFCTLVPTAFVIAATVKGTRSERDRETETRRLVRGVAQELGLQFHGRPLGNVFALASGQADGHGVRILVEKSEAGLNTVVEVSGVGLRDLSMEKARRLGFARGRVSSGVEQFDAAVHVRGPAGLVLGALSDDVRAAALRCIGRGATLERAVLSRRFHRVGSVAQLRSVVGGMVELAAALRHATAGPRPAILLRRIQSSDALPLRVRCLQVLLAEHPASPAARDARAFARTAPIPELRAVLVKMGASSGELSLSREQDPGALSLQARGGELTEAG